MPALHYHCCPPRQGRRSKPPRKETAGRKGAATQLANDAARGDKKSIQLIIALLQAFEPTIEAQRPKEVFIYSGVLAEADRRA